MFAKVDHILEPVKEVERDLRVIKVIKELVKLHKKAEKHLL